MQVYKPKMFCSPVDKNNEGIVDEDAYLMCYDLKKIKGESKFKKITVFTNDQFVSEKIKVEKQKHLCVPSTILGDEPEPVICEEGEVFDPISNQCVPDVTEPLCEEGFTHNGEECIPDVTEQ